jgi:hypothetical protein
MLREISDEVTQVTAAVTLNVLQLRLIEAVSDEMRESLSHEGHTPTRPDP